MRKIIYVKAYPFLDYNLNLGFIENKLCYIGRDSDDIAFNYRDYKIKSLEKFEQIHQKYLTMIDNFANKIYQKIDLNDFRIIGTIKQIKVWTEMAKTTYGEYITYGDLAKRLNIPTAVRFVGTTVGKNPLLLLIPCHRIISKNGTINFRSGVDMKKFLIKNGY